MEEIYDNQVQGLFLCSKARWIENGEKKYTKYFSKLGKTHFESRVIHKLNINDKRQ